MLKKLACVLLLLSASAMANMPCCAQFGGFYVGVNAGWGHDDFQLDDLERFAAAVDTNLPHTYRTEEDGFVGGVQFGYNWQPCCSLLGIEFDWNGSCIRNSKRGADGDELGLIDTSRVKHELHWFGTVRGRAGVVVDCLLFYGTLGVAFTHRRETFSVTENDPLATETFRRNDCRCGGVAGVGAEWMLDSCFSVRAEVLHFHFGESHRRITSRIHRPGQTYRIHSHDSLTVGRIGINYIWRSC